MRLLPLLSSFLLHSKTDFSKHQSASRRPLRDPWLKCTKSHFRSRKGIRTALGYQKHRYFRQPCSGNVLPLSWNASFFDSRRVVPTHAAYPQQLIYIIVSNYKICHQGGVWSFGINSIIVRGSTLNKTKYMLLVKLGKHIPGRFFAYRRFCLLWSPVNEMCVDVLASDSTAGF